MFGRSKRTLAYLGALIAVFVLFNWKLLLTNQFTLAYGPDSMEGSYSWFSFWARTVKAGILPIWDPYTWAGRPFVGEMQTAVFYPLNVLLLLIPFHQDGIYARFYWDIVIMLGHLLGLFFMFALMRELKMSRFTALIASICFSFAGIGENNLLWADVLHTAIWLPLIALFLFRALRQTKPRDIALNASLSGLFFGISILAGRLHFVLIYGLFIIAAPFFHTATGRQGEIETRFPKRWFTAALLIALIIGIGACAGAVQLLPSHEFSGRSIRTLGTIALPTTQKIPYELEYGDRLNPSAWVGMLFPYGFDGKLGSGEVWVLYIGVLPFAFAIIGIWKTWKSPWTRFFTGVVAFCFLYCLTFMSVLHGALYAAVPYLYLEREATRFILLAHFSLIILSAYGLEFFLHNSLFAPVWIPLRRILKITLLSFVVLSVLCAVVGPLSADVNLWVQFSILLIILTSGLLLYLIGKPVSTGSRVIIVGLLLFDVNAYNWQPKSKTELAKSSTEDWAMLNSCKGVAAFLKRQPAPFRVQMMAGSIHPDIGDVFGVPTTTAFAATWLMEFEQFFDHQELLNNRYLLKLSSATEPGPIYQDANWKLYENPKAYPHAWLVHETLLEPLEAATSAHVKQGDIDFHRVALVSSPLRERIEPLRADGYEQVNFGEYQPNKMKLSLQTSSSALLVLSEMYYPGWRATVDGKPAAIYKVDGALRGIIVPNGTSTVVMDYKPLTIYAGGAITILTFLAVLGYGVLRLTQKRDEAVTESEPEMVKSIRG